MTTTITDSDTDNSLTDINTDGESLTEPTPENIETDVEDVEALEETDVEDIEALEESECWGR